MNCVDSTEYTSAGDDLDKQIDEAANRKKLTEVEMSGASDAVNGRLHFLMKLVGFVITCFLLFYFMYVLKDYVHAVLLWAENQPPWAVLFIFIALFTLVSLPLAWGYIVVNLACGYLFGALYGLLVTVFTATIGVLIAHIISKHFLSTHISRLLSKTDYIHALYSVISGPQAFKVVVLARLTPVPFGLQNAVFSASSMEEVLTNSDTVRTGWIILIVQLLISIVVAMFIVKKARVELDKILRIKNIQSGGEAHLNLIVCEK